jgi:hypothetical protein
MANWRFVFNGLCRFIPDWAGPGFSGQVFVWKNFSRQSPLKNLSGFMIKLFQRQFPSSIDFKAKTPKDFCGAFVFF